VGCACFVGERGVRALWVSGDVRAL